MVLNKKADNPIIGLTLGFKDLSIEKEYVKSALSYKQIHFRFFQIFVLILIIIIWLLNPLSQNVFDKLPLITNLVQVSLNLTATIYLHFKRDFKHPEIGMLVLQLYTCFGFVESYQRNIKIYTRTNFICAGALLELNTLVSMISRCSWKTNGISALIINIYLCLRFADIADIHDMRGLPLIIFSLNFLIISLGSYLHEKHDRLLFYQRHIYAQSLKRYEELIKKVLPSSILIYREEELMFFNEQTVGMLKVNESGDVEEKLKLVTVTSSEYIENDNNYGPRDYLISESPFLSQDQQQDERLFLEANLFAYLTKFKKIKNRGFLRLTGVYNCAETAKTLKDTDGNIAANDNQTKFLEIKIGSISWKGNDALIAIISEDFGMQRLHYMQEQAKYKDKLLATVSHDLRTPLNGVIGILDLVLESIFDKATRKSLQLAVRSSNLLLFMINDILDFSQISNGCLNISPTNFCVEDMISDITKLIRFQAKRKGLSFEFNNKLPGGGKYIFYSDPNRIKQVILNLLGNSLKFTQKGFIRISCEVCNVNEEPNMKLKNPMFQQSSPALKITVEDSGCGIKKGDIPKLFKLFGMLHNQESKSFNSSGVGLGLAISQNLVKILNNNRLDGEITVKSVYGTGSTFAFPLHPFLDKPEDLIVINDDAFQEAEGFLPNLKERLPELENPLPIFHSNSSHPFLRNKKATKKRILLVDDDQINILVFMKFFESFDDCEYFTAFNGEDAVNKVVKNADQNQYFDIIFMDCNMPIMDGFEATRIIKKLVADKEIPKLSIIGSTANASKTDRDNCFKCGMVDFITKPFTKKTLRDKLDLYSKYT